MIVNSYLLGGINGLKHGFFTREGGVSAGIYESLNCGHGSGDREDAVQENRRRAMAALGLSANRLVTCHQVHGKDVLYANPMVRGEQADGLVTDCPGVAIGVLTADCAPVIFADINARVIGVVHAGWRGALTGIVESGINAMVALGAQTNFIKAAIGPCIGAESYEVGPEFIQRFTDQDDRLNSFFKPASRLDHYFFDLSGFIEMRIRAKGIEQIEQSHCDTYSDDSHFFSFRRNKKAGKTDYGRALSVVVLQ